MCMSFIAAQSRLSRGRAAPPPSPLPPVAGDELELSIVMPCLNEAQTLATCIDKARSFLEASGIRGEIVVADNGSTDGSQQIAERHGARVVHATRRGYGCALAAGIAAARGRFVIMGDSDDSYDFTRLGPFVERLREGYDLVMGNRFCGGIEPGAMPPLHRFFGNPALTFLGRFLFGTNCGDYYCGLRGFRRTLPERLKLRSPGMEYALEMVIKAALFGACVAEVPTTLKPDGRNRRPHLRSWRDGWRSLKLYLVHSPRWLFWYPGLALATVGMAVMVLLLFGSWRIGPARLDVHTMVYCAVAVVLGVEAMMFAVFAKFLAIGGQLHPQRSRLRSRLGRLRPEHTLLLGAALGGSGIVGSVVAVVRWANADWGDLDPSSHMRLVIPSALAIIVGGQAILAGFMLSLLRRQFGPTRTGTPPATPPH